MKNTTKTLILATLISSLSANAKPSAHRFWTNNKDSVVANTLNVHDEYLVKDGIQNHIFYDDKGKVTRTLKYYSEVNLNPFIRSKFHEQYPGKEILGITELTCEVGMYYIITAQNGKHLFNIQSDASGQMFMKEKYKRASTN